MIWDKRLSFKLLNLQGERSHLYEYFVLVVIWDISLGLSYWTIAIISNCNMFDRKLEIFCWTCLFLFRKWLLYFSHQHNLGIPPVEGENSSTYFLILWGQINDRLNIGYMVTSKATGDVPASNLKFGSLWCTPIWHWKIVWTKIDKVHHYLLEFYVE